MCFFPHLTSTLENEQFERSVWQDQKGDQFHALFCLRPFGFIVILLLWDKIEHCEWWIQIINLPIWSVDTACIYAIVYVSNGNGNKFSVFSSLWRKTVACHLCVSKSKVQTFLEWKKKTTTNPFSVKRHLIVNEFNKKPCVCIHFKMISNSVKRHFRYENKVLCFHRLELVSKYNGPNGPGLSWLLLLFVWGDKITQGVSSFEDAENH